MSKESFLAEFYPIPADEATSSWLEATNHSIRKWKGLLPNNLKKHNQQTGTKEHERHIVSTIYGRTLSYGTSTCALCLLAFKRQEGQQDYCENCPLFLLYGIECGERNSAYTESRLSKNPQLMINALYATQRFLLASSTPPSPRSIFSSPIMDFTEVPQ